MIIRGHSRPRILQIHLLHQVATGIPSHVHLRRRGIIVAIFRGFGINCMVPSDWDLALKCVCGPNFTSFKIGESPILLACLFVWLNKTRTVKPLRRFHSWILSFTQDSPAFSTKTTRRALQFQPRSALSTS